MLTELILYRIGFPTVAEIDAFWIYTNLTKDELAGAMYLMLQESISVSEDNLITFIRTAGFKAERINEVTMPVDGGIDPNMN
jgi:hypothetical protein